MIVNSILSAYLYTAACKRPENLHSDQSRKRFSSMSQMMARPERSAYSVPIKPELVNIPERLPSSAGLYQLQIGVTVHDA